MKPYQVLILCLVSLSARVAWRAHAASISYISPNPCPTAAGTALTIFGSFGTSRTPSVVVDGGSCSLNSFASSAIVCTLTNGGAGSSVAVAVTSYSTAFGVTTSSTVSSNLAFYAPVISGVSPSSWGTSGGETLSITGQYFNPYSTRGGVYAGTTGLNITSWSDSLIVATTPSGVGSKQDVVVVVSGQVSSAYTCSYTAPTVTLPFSLPTKGGSVTLTGLNFGPNSASGYVSFYSTIWSTVNLTVTSWSNNVIIVTSLEGVGLASIWVCASDQCSSKGSIWYAAPVISSFSPASSNTSIPSGSYLTIQGSNFGKMAWSSQFTIKLGSSTLTWRDWFDTGDYVTCFFPSSGVGKNLLLSMTGGLTTVYASSYFSYNSPVISSVISKDIPASGGSITITGTNFGPSGNSGSVSTGYGSCSVTSWDHTQILCNVPQGVGTGVGVNVTTGTIGSTTQTSNSVTFNYSAPYITSTIPLTNLATTGGQSLTIYGANFGSSSSNGVIMLGPTTLTPSFWNNSYIVCTTVAGTGSSLSLYVTVSNQKSNSTAMSFYGPRITSVSPSANLATSGGTVVSIYGQYFGASTASGYVSILGMNFSSYSIWSDSFIVGYAPSGVGAILSLVVTVGGQASNGWNVSYAAPAISSISPTNFSTAGGQLVTVSGMSFGSSSTNGSVTANGFTCTSQTWSNAQIFCLIPAGVGTGLQLYVTVASQISGKVSFNYKSPALTTMNPTSLKAAGGEMIVLSGSNFGSSNSSGYVLANSIILSCPSWSHTSVTCISPSGVGTGFSINVTVSGQVSSSLQYSYSSPSINTLSPTSLPSSGGTISIAGVNFGISDSTSSVSAGSSICTVSFWNDSLILCDVSSGMGGNFSVNVTAGGQTSNSMTFSRTTPSITSLSSSTFSAAGGDVVIITGTNFGSTGYVTSDLGNFTVLSWGNGQITVSTIAGVGYGFYLTVVVGSQSSGSVSFSYSSPSITSVTPTLISTVGGIVSICGSNFGSSSANGSVVAGSSSCSILTWNDSFISCTVAVGVGANLSIFTTVGGQISGSVSFSYDAPMITSTTPSQLQTLGGTVTISGSNFGATSSAGSVLVDSSSCQILTWTHTLISCIASEGTGGKALVSVFVGSQMSNPFAVSYRVPVISSISTTFFATSGGFVTVDGSDFGPSAINAKVYAGSVQITDFSSWSHSSFSFDVPSGVGTNLQLYVDVSGQSSNSVIFSYEAPAIAAVIPSVISTSGDILTVTGSNFGETSSTGAVFVGSSDCKVLSWSHTSISCLAPEGVGTLIEVFVSVDSQSSNLYFINYSIPVISFLTPEVFSTLGGIAFVYGSNFGSSSLTSEVYVDAIRLESFMSWSHSSFSFDMPSGVGCGLRLFLNVSGQNSNAVSYSYNAPQVSSISPSLVATSGGEITISGSNFGSSDQGLMQGSITVGSKACSVKEWADGSITCSVPAGSGQNLEVSVEIANQSTIGSSVSYIPPTISSISPIFIPTAGGIVSVFGSNFATFIDKVSVFLNNNTCVVNAVDDSEIQFIAATGVGSSIAIWLIVDGQLSNIFQSSYALPVLSNVMPSHLPTSGGVVTITGSNFGPSNETGSIVFGSSICQVQNWSDSNVVCQVPAGGGREIAVVANVSLQVSSPFLFAYDAPVVSSISSTSLSSRALSNYLLTITGSNFALGTSIVHLQSSTADQLFTPEQGADMSRLQVHIPYTLSFGTYNLSVVSFDQLSTCDAPSCTINVVSPQLTGFQLCATCGNASYSVVIIEGYDLGAVVTIAVDGATCVTTNSSLNETSGLFTFQCSVNQTLSPGQSYKVTLDSETNSSEVNQVLSGSVTSMSTDKMISKELLVLGWSTVGVGVVLAAVMIFVKLSGSVKLGAVPLEIVKSKLPS